MKTNDKENEVNAYRVGNLSLLQIMAVLAAFGLIAEWVLRSFFAV